MEKMKFIGAVDFEELRSQRVKVYDTITLDLATARADVELTLTGNYIYALEATDIDTLLQVRLNERPRSLIPLYKGRGIRAPFYRLYLTNTAQAGKTITIAIGIESDTFEVFDVGKALELSGFVKVDGTDGPGAYASVGLVVSPTMLIAANASRKRIHILNMSATLLILYLGTDNSVTTGNGLPVYPMIDTPELARITLHHKGEIWMAGTGGALRYFEETYL